jgi:hypothetical protein
LAYQNDSPSYLYNYCHSSNIVLHHQIHKKILMIINAQIGYLKFDQAGEQINLIAPVFNFMLILETGLSFVYFQSILLIIPTLL